MHVLEDVHFNLPKGEESQFDVVGMGLIAVDWIVQLPYLPQRNS